MAVMTWFAVDCNLYTHPKLMQLASALKIDPDSAAGKLGRLWAWAKQSGNEDGNINWLPHSEIADIMRWKKKPSVLIDALVECGFLDNLDDGLHIHGWADLNGRLQEKKRKDRERKFHGNSTEIPDSIHGNSAPTRPDHTLPTLSSPTVQKECKAAKPPAPAREKHGQYGWVRLTETEYMRLIDEFGQEETKRAITYVDESAQSNGNKNKWKDWNLVVRKCIRQGWGRQPSQTGGSFSDVFGDW